jgi:hypothetical protein
MENPNQEGQHSLKAEEIVQLSEKVEQGQELTYDEIVKITRGLPGIKKTMDGLYSRMKTAEEENKQLKDKPPVPEAQKSDKPDNPPAPSQQAPVVDEIETVLALRAEGYSEKEILEIRRVAKDMQKPIDEVVKMPFIKPWVEEERAKARSTEATPQPAGNVLSAGGKTFAQMTPEERGKNWDSLMSKAAKNKNE